MATSLCSEVLVTDVFHDHASVAARLNVENVKPKILTWPRSSQIPWDEIQIADWQLHCEDVTFPPLTEATQTMRSFAISFEGSLDGFVQDYPGKSLPTAHCGRAQRLRPAHLEPTPRSCTASRPGEEEPVADTVGKAVILWFKQLRRLQSYRHAICAGQTHDAAVHYRIELWSAIRRSKGFDRSFPQWWEQHDFYSTLGPLP